MQKPVLTRDVIKGLHIAVINTDSLLASSYPKDKAGRAELEKAHLYLTNLIKWYKNLY